MVGAARVEEAPRPEGYDRQARLIEPNAAEQGHIYAKTGSLGGVKSLSGYATTQHGDRIAFSILSNNFSLPNKRVTDAIDAILEAFVENGPSRKK